MDFDGWFVYKNVPIYFFSAVFQGNMALLGLTGLFIFFKIQQIQDKVRKAKEELSSLFWKTAQTHLKTLIYGLPIDFDNTSVDFWFEKIFTLAAGGRDIQPDVRNWACALTEELSFIGHRTALLIRAENEMNAVRKQMNSPFILTMAVIVLSLIMLPMSHFYYVNSLYFLKLAVCSTLIFNIMAIYYNARFILSVLRNESS
jgi:hypothetical protein